MSVCVCVFVRACVRACVCVCVYFVLYPFRTAVVCMTMSCVSLNYVK